MCIRRPPPPEIRDRPGPQHEGGDPPKGEDVDEVEGHRPLLDRHVPGRRPGNPVELIPPVADDDRFSMAVAGPLWGSRGGGGKGEVSCSQARTTVRDDCGKEGCI